jgi:hypothetical protein
MDELTRITHRPADNAARFDLDEPLLPLDEARPGLLTATEMDALLTEWGAVKVDEWGAVAALNRAAAAVRSAVGAPADAPISKALAVAQTRTGPVVARAVAAYRGAAARYEEVRADLADIRRRAYARPAA